MNLGEFIRYLWALSHQGKLSPFYYQGDKTLLVELIERHILAGTYNPDRKEYSLWWRDWASFLIESLIDEGDLNGNYSNQIN